MPTLCSASCQVLGTQCWIKHCEPWTDPISLLYNDFPGEISRKVIVSRNGRDSCCPLVTYRTLNLVTFSWIESPPLIGTLLADVLKDSWKDLWNCPGYRHFFKCSVTMHLHLKKLLSFLSFFQCPTEHFTWVSNTTYGTWLNFHSKFYKMFTESK